MKAMFLAAIGISLSPLVVQASSDDYYDNESLPSHNFFNIPTPPVEEAINVGGFRLVVDPTQVGYSLNPQGSGDMAGFRGHNFIVRVRKVPQSGVPINQLAAKMNPTGASRIQVAEVRGKKSLQGTRVTYGGKPNFFSSNIQGITYFFTNPQGETICFEATATAPHVDWSYVKYFIPDTISAMRS